MIGVINLGNSNLKSLTNTLDFLKINYKVVTKSKELKDVKKLILPGVGTFGSGMERLEKLDLITTIIEEVKIKKKPILGINVFQTLPGHFLNGPGEASELYSRKT